MKKKIPISIIRHQDLWNSVILVILYLFQLIIFYITTNLYKSILNKINELSHSFPPNFFRRIRYHLPAHISFPSNIDNSSLRFMKQCYFSHIISISAHNLLYNYLFIIGKSILNIVVSFCLLLNNVRYKSKSTTYFYIKWYQKSFPWCNNIIFY